MWLPYRECRCGSFAVRFWLLDQIPCENSVGYKWRQQKYVKEVKQNKKQYKLKSCEIMMPIYFILRRESRLQIWGMYCSLAHKDQMRFADRSAPILCRWGADHLAFAEEAWVRSQGEECQNVMVLVICIVLTVSFSICNYSQTGGFPINGYNWMVSRHHHACTNPSQIWAAHQKRPRNCKIGLPALLGCFLWRKDLEEKNYGTCHTNKSTSLRYFCSLDLIAMGSSIGKRVQSSTRKWLQHVFRSNQEYHLAQCCRPWLLRGWES